MGGFCSSFSAACGHTECSRVFLFTTVCTSKVRVIECRLHGLHGFHGLHSLPSAAGETPLNLKNKPTDIEDTFRTQDIDSSAFIAFMGAMTRVAAGLLEAKRCRAEGGCSQNTPGERAEPQKQSRSDSPRRKTCLCPLLDSEPPPSPHSLHAWACSAALEQKGGGGGVLPRLQ